MSNKQVVAATVRRKTRVAGSATDQLAQLDIGEATSVSRRFDIGDIKSGEEVKSALAAMRAALGGVVNRLTQDEDFAFHDFKTESGTFLTDDKNAIIATVAVTRLS